jgi:hypothetical protein
VAGWLVVVVGGGTSNRNPPLPIPSLPETEELHRGLNFDRAAMPQLVVIYQVLSFLELVARTAASNFKSLEPLLYSPSIFYIFNIA